MNFAELRFSCQDLLCYRRQFCHHCRGGCHGSAAELIAVEFQYFFIVKCVVSGGYCFNITFWELVPPSLTQPQIWRVLCSEAEFTSRHSYSSERCAFQMELCKAYRFVTAGQMKLWSWGSWAALAASQSLVLELELWGVPCCTLSAGERSPLFKEEMVQDEGHQTCTGWSGCKRE